MRRLLNEDEPESESLIASPVRTPQLALSNRRGFQMERRHRDLSLDEVEINDSAQAAVHMEFSGGGYASFNPNGHSQDREEDESPMDNAPPLFGKYGDFHTIDWQRDLARDRLRHKLIAGKRADFPQGMLQSAWDAGAGWLCVLLVGLASGAIAGVIDIGARWMSDLKDGICANRFWLDREHCCWSSNDTFYRDSDCGAWMTWPELFNYSNSSPIFYVVEFLFYVGMAVLMSTLAVLFVKVFAPYACGSGIPEIKCILSGFVIRGYLGKWTFLIKSVGLILACASGLNLGKEGPTVHLACCIGNILSYIFPKYGMNEAKKREILSASAAAGVSVAFGAPIGGVLFSLEEASYYFPLKTMWRSFFCALIAGIILRIVNPFGSDQTSLFHVDYMIKWRFFELVPIIGLGLFGGILGSLFIFANIRWCRLRKNSKLLGQNPINEVIIVTLVTAVISYFNPYMRRSTSSVVKQLFDRCGPEDYMVNLCDYQNKSFTSNKVDDNYHTGIFGSNMNSAFAQLVMALIFRFILTVFTFGIKVPCGLFIPSIAMGAIAGRLTGVAMEGFVSGMQQESGHSSYWSCQIGKDCVMPGLYAMVGAAAVLGGITRMTVSLVVIMFELTGSLEFIVPTMVATMFSKWIADAISKEGIYDAHIELNGYPFLDNKGEYPYSTVASQVMRPTLDSHTELVVLTQEGMTLGDVEAVLRDNEFNGFPVVLGRGNMILVGFVSRRDLQLAIHSARKTQPYIVTTSPIYFTNQPTLHEPTSSSSMPGTPSAGTAAPLRLKKILDLVLVTKNGKVLGIITKKDILQFMRQMEDDGMINPNYNPSSK
ncbi:hypothetical protein WR25_15237 [Diploscapter pachys]|uniref:Chloride channel protein n=1 Tax=Diploscapter pachys TaxID=2018661 RepID=A0A2A2LUQ7_9BILA|nr:hypothetical protein WR25_15237 [Diploscapter pachys]